MRHLKLRYLSYLRKVELKANPYYATVTRMRLLAPGKIYVSI